MSFNSCCDIDLTSLSYFKISGCNPAYPVDGSKGNIPYFFQTSMNVNMEQYSHSSQHMQF